MFFKEIETDRLILRNISTDDREFIFKEFSSEDISRYLYDEEPLTSVDEADGIIDFYIQPEPRQQHRWILTLKDSGEKIGTCGFHCWDKDSGYAEIGYDMQSANWGKGYMTEAVTAIIKFAENEMKLKKLSAHIYPQNEKSQRLAERMNMKFLGETVNYTFRGKDYLHNVYTLLF